jgi:hemerythrin
MARPDDEMSVGVRLLDSDHRELANAINELRIGVEQKQDRSLTGPLLSKVADFCPTHFALEEAIMAATGYGGLTQHRANHEHMMKQLNVLVARYDEDGMNLDSDAVVFLSEWHNSHLYSHDLKYGEWLNEHSRS